MKSNSRRALMREEALIGTWAINRKITVSLNKRFKVLY